MRKTLFLPLAAGLILTLSACNRKAEEKAPDPEPTADSSTEPTQSIIRPDFQEPEMDLPLPALVSRIGFEAEGYELNDAATEELTAILESEQVAKGWPIMLHAHSDSGGNDRGNIAASQKRGEAVQSWLTENGVAEERITIIAFGEQNPAEPNALPDGSPNEEGRAANRRVEITIGDPDAAESEAAFETESAVEGDVEAAPEVAE